MKRPVAKNDGVPIAEIKNRHDKLILSNDYEAMKTSKLNDLLLTDDVDPQSAEQRDSVHAVET